MSELGLRHWLVLLLCEPENSNNSCQPLTSDIFMVFCLEILRPNPKKNMVYGTLCQSSRVDYNLTLCPLYSTPTHLLWATLCRNRPYPYMAESTLSPQSGSSDLASAIATYQVDDIHIFSWASNCQCQSGNSPEAICLVLMCDFLIYDIFMLFLIFDKIICSMKNPCWCVHYISVLKYKNVHEVYLKELRSL